MANADGSCLRDALGGVRRHLPWFLGHNSSVHQRPRSPCLFGRGCCRQRTFGCQGFVSALHIITVRAPGYDEQSVQIFPDIQGGYVALDCVLLIAFVIPGVVALVVDGASGAWNAARPDIVHVELQRQPSPNSAQGSFGGYPLMPTYPASAPAPAPALPPALPPAPPPAPAQQPGNATPPSIPPALAQPAAGTGNPPN